jgi:4-amino-4-deoxychorismate lyase
MLINGIETDQVPANDRGFQYGDGLFETVAVENGKPVFLLRHLLRLRRGCERLGIEFPGQEILESESRKLGRSVHSAVLKIIVTRGSGGRGYRLPDSCSPTRVLSLHPWPKIVSRLQASGIRTRLCKTRLASNPSLAGLKHLNRLEQVLARAEWNDPDIHEGFMLDRDGKVVEGTMSNLFVVRRRSLITPDLGQCGVEGIVRTVVLAIAREKGIEFVVKAIDVCDLERADEIFVTNSIIGIWPVIGFEGVSLGIGQITRNLIRWFNEHKE